MRSLVHGLLIAALLMLAHSPPASASSYADSGRFYTTRGGMLGVIFNAGWPSIDQPDVALLCRTGQCYLGAIVTIERDGAPVPTYPVASVNTVTYVNGELLSVVRQRWVAKNGTIRTVDEPNYGYPSSILPWTSTARGCFQYWPNFNNNATVGVPLPGTVCNTPAPPDVSCESLPSMIYDFGTVAGGSTSGLRLLQRQTLSCTNATNVTLKLATDLKLTDMLTANVTVNGKPLDTHGVTLAVGRNTTPLDFVVTINGNENTGGEYTASSVLIMEYR